MIDKLIRIDTNILIVLIVGLVNADILGKHARTKKYFAADLDLLADCIGSARIVLLPNVVTEAHNLLKQHGNPERSYLLKALKSLMFEAVENYVPSKVIAGTSAYDSLGVTDAALLEVRSPRLLTDDFDLYHRAMLDRQDVLYFTHLRVKAGIVPQL